ncbi:hypothetical protein OH809_05470 [Streptomyces sp. NBC_00873]|uniref:hypothetical protein n=1 Tax=Streptomyces sp. NBC_00873 TaxID=2975852 RepID=UPI00386D9555|nr:hypothetical protein OH809_05470 [Streptomyces sp. NBC_00873]
MTGSWDAVGTAAAVRSGEADARAVVEDAITRIERLNPEYNAVIHTRFDRRGGGGAATDSDRYPAALPPPPPLTASAVGSAVGANCRGACVTRPRPRTDGAAPRGYRPVGPCGTVAAGA